MDDGTDALRVLFHDMPPGFSAQDPATFAARWKADVTYRTSLLAAMQALSGSYDGRASDGNILLVLAVATLVDAGKITSARNLALKAPAINKGLLEPSAVPRDNELPRGDRTRP